MASPTLPAGGRVPYREVHELLVANGYELKKSITEKSIGGGEELHRVYVVVEGAPGPLIHFPVKDKTISRDHYEKIKEILRQRRGGSEEIA